MRPYKTQFNKGILLVAGIVMLACTTTQTNAQASANQPLPKGFFIADIIAVDNAVNTFMRKYNIPGLSFAIAKGDSLKIQRSYGYADSARKELVSIDSRFRIASVSKPFTAAAIMLLVQQGKLKLSNKFLVTTAYLVRNMVPNLIKNG